MVYVCVKLRLTPENGLSLNNLFWCCVYIMRIPFLHHVKLLKKLHLLEGELKTKRAQSQRSVFKSQTLQALFFYFHEALCGWEETKNNLHNMVEKKLIPPPASFDTLSHAFNLMLYDRVCLLPRVRVCVCIITRRGERACGEGWEKRKLMNTVRCCCGIPPACVALPQHCSKHCALILSSLWNWHKRNE